MASIKKLPFFVYCNGIDNYVSIEEHCEKCGDYVGRVNDNIMCTYN